MAPDWSADWLHRESEILLNTWGVRAGAANFAALGPDQQAVFKARLIREMRTNTYDASCNRVTLRVPTAPQHSSSFFGPTIPTSLQLAGQSMPFPAVHW